MELTQEQIYEAFGFEPPKEEPQNETQSEPKDEPEGTGANEQQAAEAAPEGNDPQAEQQSEPKDEPEGTGANEQQAAEAAPKERDERNASFAAARRKAEAERDRAIAEERAKAEQRIQKIFQQAGMVDPESGRPIASEQELAAFARRIGEQKKSMLREQGITDEDIAMLPEMQKKTAREQQLEQELARYRAQSAERALADEMRRISEIDSTVKTVADIRALPEYQDIYERVGRGYTLTDAFTLATAQRRAKAAQQSAAPVAEPAKKPAAKQDGKQHLTKTAASGGGSVSTVTVPEETMRLYKYLFPEKTKKELTEHYAKQHRK